LIRSLRIGGSLSFHVCRRTTASIEVVTNPAIGGRGGQGWVRARGSTLPCVCRTVSLTGSSVNLIATLGESG